MASYSQLPSSGTTNVGYISKNLKELSFKIRETRSLTTPEYLSAESEIISFQNGVKELVFHSNVPKEQSAKNFALKNQYNNLIACFESIQESRKKLLEIQIGENLNLENHQLNEKYDDHENVYKDICGLYEIFKEFEEEEIRKRGKEEKMKNSDSSGNCGNKEMNEVKDNGKMEVKVLCQETEEKNGEKSLKGYLWIVVLIVLALVAVGAVYALAS